MAALKKGDGHILLQFAFSGSPAECQRSSARVKGDNSFTVNVLLPELHRDFFPGKKKVTVCTQQ